MNAFKVTAGYYCSIWIAAESGPFQFEENLDEARAQELIEQLRKAITMKRQYERRNKIMEKQMKDPKK